MEASPSPVYGAALLMRLGAYTPSGVQIPEPPPLAVRPVQRGQASDQAQRLNPPRFPSLPPSPVGLPRGLSEPLQMTPRTKPFREAIANEIGERPTEGS